MSHDDTVNAGDIARLVDVGRAAVSNWRRRHEDFPRPVGGTASSPLFSLAEVEEWLRRNGKSYEVSLADRAWQRLRASGDDLNLGHLVARAGAFLLSSQDNTGELLDTLPGPAQAQPPDRELMRLLAELATERGHLGAFEFLCERYLQAHSRRLVTTPQDAAELMVRLACPHGGSVFDPACGLGTLLTTAPATRVLGQDTNADHAVIAAARLLLRGRSTEIVNADSLRQNDFSGAQVDAVLCDPPFNERTWGHEELTSDPRWEYGLPPRGESELAWVQHCLAHVKPGGLVAIRMPTAAASRRAGKRIRGNLLRAGALRAVITLQPGGSDLWMLRRPRPGDRPPAHVLLLDDPGDAETAWREYLDEPETGASIIELLDDDVDLSPARRRARYSGAHLAREFVVAANRLHGTGFDPPALDAPDEAHALPGTTIGELARAGLLSIRHAPAKMTTGAGDLPVLTAQDVADGAEPSGRTEPGDELVDVRPGDVVASGTGAARVIDTEAVLGPYLTRYRMDPGRLDPSFLAGCLRSADSRAPASSSRTDVRRTHVPRLPVEEQRRYGKAFRQLLTLEDTLRETAALGETLIRLGFAGLADGHLRPRR